MTELLKQLSNREIATLVWLGLFLIWTLMMPKIRQSMGGVIKAFCQPVILKVVGLAVLYITCSVWLLYRLGIWTADFTYSTLTWAVTFALVAVFEANKMSSDKRHIAKIIREVINVTAVLIFIIELHSFSLIIELISLPILIIITAMYELAKIKDEHAAVEKLLGKILVVVALAYLWNSIWGIWAGYEEINGLDTLRAFLIPILLSLLFLPFLFGLGVYMAYERIFTYLSLRMDEKLLRYAKRQAVIKCRANLNYLDRWQSAVQRERPETMKAIDEVFDGVRTVLKREKSPPAVDPEDGWSPWSAKDFMLAFELETRDYHQGYEGKWFAESNLKPVGATFSLNNIAYSIEGEVSCAKELKLKLHVSAPDNDAQARALFSQAALHLFIKACQSEPPRQIALKIDALEDFELVIGPHAISLKKDDWSYGTRPEYYLVFKVQMKS